jgi:D-alanyl-D-alanine carboxypeptidase
MSQPDLLSLALSQRLDRYSRARNCFGLALSVYQHERGFEWHEARGNLKPDSLYFVASTTKLYITCLCLILEAEDRLGLDEKVCKLLSTEDAEGLDPDITVRHLLSHTSGLPDYFQSASSGRAAPLRDLQRNQDFSWSYSDALQMALSQKKAIAQPGKRAFYSDTNYQILGRILENLDSCLLEDIIERRICAPLSLQSTYLFTDPKDTRPASIYYKQNQMQIPKAMASFRADGGIVSTAQDSLRFTRAFFEGTLFPKERLTHLYQWRRIFFPFDYGIGLMRFELPWFFSPFRRYPALIGHSGLSGAFAFYCPDREIYLAGTVNQLDAPSFSFRLMLEALDAFRISS